MSCLVFSLGMLYPKKLISLGFYMARIGQCRLKPELLAQMPDKFSTKPLCSVFVVTKHGIR